ncbi:reverse transcriptase [Penicillium longicatenatum]|uniref:reverse transcriptase n=1 Tax=Penicillium longicatenatum TaxID=1561947 RepID=UPI002547BA1E|nr:reverse transcriptase [Penicillium longicatenatum]KAJ5639537.1 reverse transcriptase [Penicillium longicatenatum]
MAASAGKQYGNKRRSTGTYFWRTTIIFGKREVPELSGDDAAFGKVPQLLRVDGTITTDHKEQAEEPLTNSSRPCRTTLTMKELGHKERRGGTAAVGRKVLESPGRRRSTGDSVEDDMARGQAQGLGDIPSVAGRRHIAEAVETCEDYTAQKAE